MSLDFCAGIVLRIVMFIDSAQVSWKKRSVALLISGKRLVGKFQGEPVAGKLLCI